MIRVKLSLPSKKSLDAPSDYTWPTELSCRPLVGDRILGWKDNSLGDTKAQLTSHLKIAFIYHAQDEQGPYLHLSLEWK